MSFKLAKLDAQSEPLTKEKAVDSSVVSFNKGALLTVDAQDEYVEAGADPAIVQAIALHGYGANTTGFGAIGGRREFPAGRCVAVGARGQRFRARYTGTPALGAFGVVRDANGDWLVDFTDAVATRFQVTRLLNTELGGITEVEGYFLDANTAPLP